MPGSSPTQPDMRILIVGLNYAPEPIGIAIYTAGLADHLAQSGHEVRVVAGQPYYPQWRVLDGYRGGWRTRIDPTGVTITRCPIYVPRVPSGARRLIHHASFALSAFFPSLAAARGFRPDIVLTIAPSLASAPIAWLAARLARARSWLHVQDFEVEAAFATGLMDPSSRLARFASGFERRILGLFDRVSSISPEMCAKLAVMGIPKERIVEFRNWAGIPPAANGAVQSRYRVEWDIRTPHVALYSGNIANKQGIETVLEAARLLRRRDDLTFVICGEGPNLARLREAAGDLSNLQFRPLQPVERLAELLQLASVHLLPQKPDAADLVLPSKLTNMLASGRPVVATAMPGTGLAREVEGCGIATPPEDASAFAAAIERLIDNRPLWETCATQARDRAETRWEKKRTIADVTAAMHDLIARPARPPRPA